MTYALFRGSIPPWIKELRAPGYTNIFELCDPPTIFGTEHLCGDWDGKLLVLAKDFAPAEVVRPLARRLPAHLAYRHNDGDDRYVRTGLRTNKQLMRWMFNDTSLIDGRQATRCGAVYGSACFFLKSGDTSADLSDWQHGTEAWEGSRRVVEYSIAQMPRLRAIVALGGEALALLSKTLGFETQTVSAAMGRRLGSSMPVYAAPHPSRGSNLTHQSVWAFIRKDTGIGG